MTLLRGSVAARTEGHGSMSPLRATMFVARSGYLGTRRMGFVFDPLFIHPLMRLRTS